MRHILVLAIVLLATGAIAEDRRVAIKRVFGMFEVTHFPSIARKHKTCKRLRPPPATSPLGRAVIGDGCMGCSVSPVYRCETLHPKGRRLRENGFEITRRDGKPFRISQRKTGQLLRRYCRADGKQVSVSSLGERGGTPATASWHDGNCR